ncbi:unnamed protein product [Bathycoccus prasinos]
MAWCGWKKCTCTCTFPALVPTNLSLWMLVLYPLFVKHAEYSPNPFPSTVSSTCPAALTISFFTPDGSDIETDTCGFPLGIVKWLKMDTGIVCAFSVLNAWDLSYVLKMHSVLLNATSRAKPFAPFEENETSTKERTWKREEIVVIFVLIPFFQPCKAVSTLGRNRIECSSKHIFIFPKNMSIDHRGGGGVLDEQPHSSSFLSLFKSALYVWHSFVRCVGVYAFVQIGKTIVIYKKKYPYKRVVRGWVPWSGSEYAEDVLVVDCTHAKNKTITHHKGSSTPREVKVGDTSTENVLHAIKTRHRFTTKRGKVSRVTCDHFDIDGLISVFSVLHPNDAVKYEEILVEAARIGDFREFEHVNVVAPASVKALRLCSYINQVEKERFNLPFVGDEKENCLLKYKHFLEYFKGYVVACGTCDVDRIHEEFELTMEGEEEFSKVLRDAKLVREHKNDITKWLEVSTTMIKLPKPVHYYALFGATVGTDTCIAIYDGKRYEVEHNGKSLASPIPVHSCVSTTSPLSARLTKAERYQHPDQRKINPSSIPQSAFLETVKSYLTFGQKEMARYAKINPLAGREVDCVGDGSGYLRGKNWTWKETQTLNANVDWSAWDRERTSA